MSKALQTAAFDQVHFVAQGGDTRIDVRIDNETVWLTQGQIADLFGRKQPVISHHVRKVFSEGELEEGGNIEKINIASSDRPLSPLCS
jgi:hypothetical protein